MMQKLYLITYDICEDKRLDRVYKLMRGYGEHIQYSVFLSELTPKTRTELESRLERIINNREDQILFVDLGPATGRGRRVISALGRSFTQPGFAEPVIV